MHATDTLEILLARTALDDRQAFEALYRRTSGKLFGICLRILRSRGDAEEAVQEAYVKIWRNARQYSFREAKPIAWLAAIARNQAIDKLRARKPPGESLDSAGELVDDAPLPDTHVVVRDEARRLGLCLDQLDPDHAGAVKRTYLQGWSYKDAAEELNIPLNTVKTWIRRSLIRLRDCVNR